MRTTTTKTWGADHIFARYQAAGPAFPVLELTLTTGPEAGRRIIADLDVDDLYEQLRAMIAERNHALTMQNLAEASGANS